MSVLMIVFTEDHDDGDGDLDALSDQGYSAVRFYNAVAIIFAVGASVQSRGKPGGPVSLAGRAQGARERGPRPKPELGTWFTNEERRETSGKHRWISVKADASYVQEASWAEERVSDTSRNGWKFEKDPPEVLLPTLFRVGALGRQSTRL